MDKLFNHGYSCRIKKADGKILNAGTGEDSWFNLETARKLVNRSEGQIIIVSDGCRECCEIF